MSSIKASIVCILMSIWSSVGVAKTEIRMVFSDWCPYMCVDDNNIGYAVELFRFATSDMDIQITTSKHPYFKAIQMLKAGEADVIPAMYKYDLDGISGAKAQVAIKDNQYFILQGTDWYYTNPVSLERLSKLGLLGGQRYEPIVQLFKRKNGSSVTTLPASEGVEGLLQLLLEKKVSAILQDGNVIDYYKSKVQGGNAVKLVGTMKTPEILVTGFSDKLDDKDKLIAQYDKGVLALQESGKLSTLMAKYKINSQP